MRKSLGLALVVIGLVGCGKDSSNPPPPPPTPSITCYFAAGYECDKVTAAQAFLDANGFTPTGCTNSGGVVVSTCPAGRVGSCSLSGMIGTDSVSIAVSYYSPGYTQPDVVALCAADGGTFAPRLAGQSSTWSHIPLESMTFEQP